MAVGAGLTDTHCHLDFDSFDRDREQVIERARATGLVRILNPGIDLVSSDAAISLAEEYPEVYAAVGVHPNSSLEWNDKTLKELRELADHPKVVAIGEIGLDYYRDNAPRDIQRKVLHEQLTLAAEKKLPVILHNRQASDDILSILKGWHAQLVKCDSELIDRPGVLHSFSADMDSAKTALSMNFAIGVTGPITFRNAAELQMVITSLPIDNLLIETDAPFLAPHPFRGKRNESSYIIWIAEKIAQLKELSINTVINNTTANADRLFQWRESF